jgi:hypothetical protein
MNVMHGMDNFMNVMHGVDNFMNVMHGVDNFMNVMHGVDNFMNNCCYKPEFGASFQVSNAGEAETG